MLDQLKRTLVESYVGAIALGYLLAQVILHFVGIFTSPVSDWIIRKEFGKWTQYGAALKGYPLEDALPQLIWFFALLLLWYVLLRWLYFKPFKKETSEAVPNRE